MNGYECCETCGVRVNDFKVIDVDTENYIICQPCFVRREEVIKFQETWMKANNITMKDIEKEVKLTTPKSNNEGK